MLILGSPRQSNNIQTRLLTLSGVFIVHLALSSRWCSDRSTQSLTAARRLHRRHAEINGRLPSAAGGFPAGSRYSANAIPALQWVHATLVESALLAYGLVLPPLTLEERERYYSENRLFAALFGIPDECLPRDWTAFSAYTTAMVQSDTLIVTDHARIIRASADRRY